MTGLILILADLVLSNCFFTLFTALSLSFLSSEVVSPTEEEDEDEEEGDNVEGRCFFNLNSSFNKTVHVGGLGDGSSSRNQLILGSSLSLFRSVDFSSSTFFKLMFLSFISALCICQKGSNFPSEISSSAVIMLAGLPPERNSNSALRGAVDFSRSKSRLGHMEMNSLSSRNSAENEIRAGLAAGSTMHLDVSCRVCRETIVCDVLAR